MNIMGCRLRWLELVFAGLERTGVPFLAFDGNYRAFAGHDDVGLYYYVPRLMQLMSLPCKDALYYFFCVLLVGALCVGFIGFCALFSSWLQRSCFALFLAPATYLAWYVGDVYIAYYASVVALAPWAMYFFVQKHLKKFHYSMLFAAGLFAGFLHTLRAYSSLGAFVSIALALILNKHYRHQSKYGSLLMLIFASSLLPLFMNYSYTRYQAALSGYTQEVGDSYHPLWHTVYVGFGLLNILNTQNITFSDSCGAERGALYGHVYGTPAYEACMKQEVLALCKYNPLFVLFTLWAKLGILLFVALCFMHIGLLIALSFTRSDWFLLLPLAIVLCVNALFPVMAVPYFSYAMGFITASALCGAYIVAYGLKRKGIECIMSVRLLRVLPK